jgi:serine/threonine protein phosphatase 1
MTTSATARIIAIGDIHGCSAALSAILAAIEPGHDDLVVTLGDYVDRGPDSRGVIERLIQLDRECWLVSILGTTTTCYCKPGAGCSARGPSSP